MRAPVEHAVTVFYGGKEAYGFHALEALECMVERRKGGETGIASVECVDGPGVWTWTDAQPWAARLLDAALARSETKKPGSPRENVKTPILFRLQYRSGLSAAVYILNGHCEDCTFAADLKGVSDSLKKTIAGAETSLNTLKEGDMGKALANQPGCQATAPSGSASPSAS